MADLHRRFRNADRIPAPDLWEEIVTRRPRHAEAPPSSIWPRLAVVTVALAIVGAASFLLVRAFFPEAAPQPGVTPTESPSPQESPPPETFGPPRGIVALTASGGVVLIDHHNGTVEGTLASVPRRNDPEGGLTEAQDLAGLPDGRVLVDVCCEPAAGNIYIVDPGGNIQHGAFTGWDPQVSGPYMVRAEYIFGVAIMDVSLDGTVKQFDLPPSEVGSGPQDPSISPDGEDIVFTFEGRLGTISVSAESFSEATYLDPAEGKHWSSPVYTREGVVAVEATGSWQGIGPDRSAPGRLVRVDLGTGETEEITSTNGAITDVTVDQSGANLMWVQDGELVWQMDGETKTLEGDFLAAAWIPARPA